MQRRWSVAITAALLFSTMSARADEKKNPRIEALIRRAQSDDRAARISAFSELARLRAKGAGRKAIPRLEELTPSDAEAAAILAYWEAVPEPNTVPAAARWLGSIQTNVTDPLPPSLAGPDAERALRIAATLAARAPYAEATALALAHLAAHPSDQVAKSALAALAAQEEAKSEALLPPLLAALRRSELEPAVLGLLARIGSMKAVAAIIDSAERYQEANPRQGAPDHAAALRAITKERLGDDAGQWRRWWQAR